MKKCVAMVLTVLMLVSMCACSDDNAYQGTPEELNTILDRVAMIPVATMGVSMTITDVAVSLLDWCESTDMTDAEIAAATKTYYDSVESANKDMFYEQVYLTVGGVRLLSNEDKRSGVLEAAGHSPKLSWDDAAFSLAMSLDDAL